MATGGETRWGLLIRRNTSAVAAGGYFGSLLSSSFSVVAAGVAADMGKIHNFYRDP
jgi:hypothetical protein